MALPKKAAKKTTKKAAKKTTKKAAKKTTKKAAKKTTKKAVKKAAKKTTKKAVKQAAKKTTKKAAKKHAMPPMHQHMDHPELDDEAHGDEVFEIFRTYDTNDSGSIDRLELSRLTEALGMRLNGAELDMALADVDRNHSGKISWKEFKRWWNDR